MIIIKEEGSALCPISVTIYESGEEFSKIFWDTLPPFIYCEVIEICRDFGFIAGGTIRKHGEIDVSEEEIQAMIEPAKTLHAAYTLLEAREILQKFFEEVKGLQLNLSQLTPDVAPYGLLRFASIYDINIQYLNYNLEQFLEYLIINLREQKKIFWSYLIDELIENSWLPIDEIKDKNELYFSNRTCVSLENFIEYKWIKYPLNVHMVPGFSPWIEFIVSVDTGWISPNNHNNIALNVAIRFERCKNKIFPVIHVLQCPYLNLWLSGDSIVCLQKIWSDNLIFQKQIFNQDMLSDFCSGVISFLLGWKYGEILFIAAPEMLWVILHNKNNPKIQQKITERYSKIYSSLTGIETNSQKRYCITRQLLFDYQMKNPRWGRKLSEQCVPSLRQICKSLWTENSSLIIGQKLQCTKE
jgi:hypothetical protein